MFTHPYIGSQLAASGTRKCSRRPSSSAWRASPARAPGQPAAQRPGPADDPRVQAHPPRRAPL